MASVKSLSLHLCSTEEETQKFGTSGRLVNYDKVLIFG